MIITLFLALIFSILLKDVKTVDLLGIDSHDRDGDTIEVENMPIRLNGVSMPEPDEPLGYKLNCP